MIHPIQRDAHQGALIKPGQQKPVCIGNGKICGHSCDILCHDIVREFFQISQKEILLHRIVYMQNRSPAFGKVPDNRSDTFDGRTESAVCLYDIIGSLFDDTF